MRTPSWTARNSAFATSKSPAMPSEPNTPYIRMSARGVDLPDDTADKRSVTGDFAQHIRLVQVQRIDVLLVRRYSIEPMVLTSLIGDAGVYHRHLVDWVIRRRRDQSIWRMVLRGPGPESLVTDFAVYPSGGHWLRDASILAAHRMRRGAFNCSAVSGPFASSIRSTVTSGSSGTEIGAAVKPWSASSSTTSGRAPSAGMWLDRTSSSSNASCSAAWSIWTVDSPGAESILGQACSAGCSDRSTVDSVSSSVEQTARILRSALAPVCRPPNCRHLDSDP